MDTVSSQERFGGFLKAGRQPLLGVFLVAICGVIAGDSSPFSPSLWACLALLSLLLSAFGKWQTFLWPGCFFLFAALQAGNTTWNPDSKIAAALSPLPKTLEAEGIVADAPKISPYSCSFPLKLEKLCEPNFPQDFRGTKVQVRWHGPPPEYGDRIRASGILSPIPAPRNPAEFNAKNWLYRQGISLGWNIKRKSDGKILAKNEGNPIVARAIETRKWMTGVLGLGMASFPEEKEIILGMTLGEMGGISQTTVEDFQITGTLHLFSVSGLHIGMLGVMLWATFRFLRVPEKIALPTIAFLLFYYAAVTGLKPSGLRAAFMAAAVLFGQMLNRPSSPVNSLSAAGILLLLADPNQLFNPGFQLSFAVVFAILLLGAPIARSLKPALSPDPFLPKKLYRPADRAHAWFAGETSLLLAVSVSAWIGSFPLIVNYFGLVSLSAIPANLLAVPLSFYSLALAVLSLCCGTFSPWLAVLLNHINALLIHALVAVIHAAAILPGGSFLTGELRWNPPTAEVVLFDFSPGESNAISSMGHAYLIDTGSAREWQSVLSPWISSRGLRKLDGIFLTHGDAKHTGGAKLATEETSPGFIAVSPLKDRSPSFGSFLLWLQETNRPKRILSAGDTLSCPPGWKVQTLFPPTGYAASLADDKSLVTRWSGFGFSFLFLGDAGAETESWLAKNNASLLPSDVLVLGRHSSGIQGDTSFLELVNPRLIVASYSEFPPSERIPENYARWIREQGIPLFQKNETGAVILEIRKNEMEARSFLSPVKRLLLLSREPG